MEKKEDEISRNCHIYTWMYIWMRVFCFWWWSEADIEQQLCKLSLHIGNHLIEKKKEAGTPILRVTWYWYMDTGVEWQKYVAWQSLRYSTKSNSKNILSFQNLTHCGDTTPNRVLLVVSLIFDLAIQKCIWKFRILVYISKYLWF